MTASKLFLLLILSICFFGCAFEENREVENKLTKAVNNFHALFNQRNFSQIYLGADEELKSKFTEQQFVSYLEVIKDNNSENLKDVSHVWLEDNLTDEVKRILFKKTVFAHVELATTEKAIYREKFGWNLRNNEAKLTAYELEKVCDKPCHLALGTK